MFNFKSKPKELPGYYILSGKNTISIGGKSYFLPNNCFVLNPLGREYFRTYLGVCVEKTLEIKFNEQIIFIPAGSFIPDNKAWFPEYALLYSTVVKIQNEKLLGPSSFAAYPKFVLKVHWEDSEYQDDIGSVLPSEKGSVASHVNSHEHGGHCDVAHDENGRATMSQWMGYTPAGERNAVTAKNMHNDHNHDHDHDHDNDRHSQCCVYR